jgi:hypothetical protein
MNYTCTVNKIVISYSLSDDELCAKEGEGMSYAMPLRGGNVTIKRRRAFSRYFYAGIVGIISPLIAFGPILLKKGGSGLTDLNLSNIVIAMHTMLFVTGIFLILRFRCPRVGFEFFRGESGICVWRDSSATDEFKRFIDAARQAIARE